MDGKDNISDYRRKLDKTLACPDLTNDELLRTLVKKQILQSSDFQLEGNLEHVVERRSKELSNLLSMLRSAAVGNVERSKSGKESHSGWNLKQDTEEFRVMYREGPEGTPFHTLLAEGYVDGPADVCLCISWESSLYRKWWPQTAVPNFKVISSRCLQRIRTGEQVSLVRMKVSWPLSSREALIHCFAFEYFEEDLIVVLLNSISDSETIDISTHGFTREGIPNAEEVVRIDVVGGFALQKVTANRSYFRTIANMDIKLDFVPPAFINFISRQLVGSGFKLYKKEVASVSKGDKEFLEALKDPLYIRIREAFCSENLKRDTSVMREDQCKETRETIDTGTKEVMVRDRNELNEIEEFEENDSKESVSLDNHTQKSPNCSTGPIMARFRSDKEEFVIRTKGDEALRTTNGIVENYGSEIEKGRISPEVEHALKTLDKVISVFREHNGNPENGNEINSANLDKEAVEEAISSEADQISRDNANCTESNSLEPRISSISHASRHNGSDSNTRETNQSKIVPDEEQPTSPSNSKHITVHSSMNHSTIFEKINENYPPIVDANSTAGNRATKGKNKKSRLCCLRASVH